MAHISGGEVTYGRTVKTGDYENKRVDIKLTFGCDDGEDVVAILDRATSLALERCHKVLGLQITSVAAGVAKTTTVKNAKTAKETVAVITAAEKAQEPAKDPAAVEDDRGNISTSPEDRKDPAQVTDELDEPAVEEAITDAAITDAMKRTNQRVKDAVKIKKLRNEFAGKKDGEPCVGADIPQLKRKAFIAALDALQ